MVAKLSPMFLAFFFGQMPVLFIGVYIYIHKIDLGIENISFLLIGLGIILKIIAWSKLVKIIISKDVREDVAT